MLSNDMWEKGYSAKKLIQNNLNAFFVGDYDHNNMYYLLQQKNGDIYIAQGYINTNIQQMPKLLFPLFQTMPYSRERPLIQA